MELVAITLILTINNNNHTYRRNSMERKRKNCSGKRASKYFYHFKIIRALHGNVKNLLPKGKN